MISSCFTNIHNTYEDVARQCAPVCKFLHSFVQTIQLRSEGTSIAVNDDTSRLKIQVSEILGKMPYQNISQQGRGQTLLLLTAIVAKKDPLALIVNKGKTRHTVQDINADVHIIMKRCGQGIEPLAIHRHHPESTIPHVTGEFMFLVPCWSIGRRTTIPLIVATNFARHCTLELEIRPELAFYMIMQISLGTLRQHLQCIATIDTAVSNGTFDSLDLLIQRVRLAIIIDDTLNGIIWPM